MNQPVRRGPVATFFVGLWDVMNFTRRLIFNLLFFGLLFLVLILLLVAVGRGSGVEPMSERTTLVIAPEGSIVEQHTVDPAMRALSKALGSGGAEEVQLRDLLRAMDAASEDANIERVLLRVDKVGPTGLATLREVAARVRMLRESGKQVIAFGEGFSQGNYLLAAQADEVYIDPMGGGVMLTGLSSYSPYFREALQDKLGVDVYVFKVGEFKSAVEPFILDGASDEAKQADLYWMNDVWQRHLQDIASARNLTVAQVEAGIDTLPEGLAAAGGDMARYALRQKLVDGLMTQEQVEDLLVERGVADEGADSGFRHVTLDGYLAQLDRKPTRLDRRPQVAVVVAEGNIMDGDQPAGTVGGESTAALLREAREDDNVKAVVLRVNSPGGSVWASEQINREVVALKEAGKPVISSMGYLAASGGYWISMNTNRIYADPSTITGSIGVFGLLPRMPRALDRIGVQTDGVATTRFAGAFDITRPMEPDVARVVQSSVEHIYGQFIGRVAAGRNQSVEAIDAVAQGRVWSGAQALERGLVDELGGLDDALAHAATLVELGEDEYRVRYIEKAPSPFARFMASFASTRVGAYLLDDSAMARSLLVRAVPQLEEHVRMVEQAMAHPEGSLAKPLAFCFCKL